MMINLFSIISILMGVSMFFISCEKKIALMFIGCMTLSLVRLNVPAFKDVNSFFVLCFLLSEFLYWKNLVNTAIVKPIVYVFLIVLFSCSISILFSPHLQDIKNIFNFIRSELFVKYFALIYAFYAIRKEKNFRTFVKISIIPMFILTLFGIVNLIEQQSSFVSEMMSGWEAKFLNSVNELAGEKFSLADRFRVQAMFFNPFDYGFICALCLLIYLYSYFKKILKKPLFLFLLGCCLFGIFFCGCRTVLFCSIISVGVFILIAFKIAKSAAVGIVAIVLMIMSYNTIPVVNEKVDEMTTMFTDTKGREVGGSSLDMRAIQFAAVLYHIQDSPLLGRGVNFFNIDLGWSDGKRGLKDTRLQGLEGVYLSYLLERGVLGYILYLSVWTILFVLLFRIRRTDKQISAFGISVLILYTLFANMTGELLSVYPTLLILGSIIGAYNRNKMCKQIVAKYYAASCK